MTTAFVMKVLVAAVLCLLNDTYINYRPGSHQNVVYLPIKMEPRIVTVLCVSFAHSTLFSGASILYITQSILLEEWGEGSTLYSIVVYMQVCFVVKKRGRCTGVIIYIHR